jgi:hypothetical protein
MVNRNVIPRNGDQVAEHSRVLILCLNPFPEVFISLGLTDNTVAHDTCAGNNFALSCHPLGNEFMVGKSGNLRNGIIMSDSNVIRYYFGSNFT